MTTDRHILRIPAGRIVDLDLVRGAQCATAILTNSVLIANLRSRIAPSCYAPLTVETLCDEPRCTCFTGVRARLLQAGHLASGAILAAGDGTVVELAPATVEPANGPAFVVIHIAITSWIEPELQSIRENKHATVGSGGSVIVSNVPCADIIVWVERPCGCCAFLYALDVRSSWRRAPCSDATEGLLVCDSTVSILSYDRKRHSSVADQRSGDIGYLHADMVRTYSCFLPANILQTVATIVVVTE